MKVDITSKRYHKKTIIRDIHFNARPGTMMLVLGTSGVGKSTLIKCLVNETGYEGSVQYEKGEGAGIAYISQHPGFNESETPLQALTYAGLYADPRAGYRKTEKKAERMLQSLGIGGVCNKRIHCLSGGQRQRVAIGREQMRNSKVWLMDEPFSALDPATARTLAKDISNVTHKQGRTTIIISHNVNDLVYFDSLLILAKGGDDVGRMAYLGAPCNMPGYFQKSDPVDVMVMLNGTDGNGGSTADYYIKAMEKARRDSGNTYLNAGCVAFQ